MTELIPLDPAIRPVNAGKYRHGDSNPGTNPASRVDRNCVLCPPTEMLTRRVRLPVVRLPHEWHEDKYRRPSCVKAVPGNAGKTYPASPIYGSDADLILDALFTPGVDDTGKWAKRWGHHRLRNRAAFATIRGTGLRIHELLLVRPVHIEPETHQLVVPRGKGGDRRIIAITQQALEEIDRWMVVRARLGFTDEDFLFPVLEGSSKGRMLGQGYLRKQVHAAAKRAGVTRRAAPHQWRHGIAVHLDRKKTSVASIQRQLGHKNPGTTGIYLSGLSNEDVVDDVLAAFDE